MANLTMSENLERILLGWARLFSEAESYVLSLTILANVPFAYVTLGGTKMEYWFEMD